MVFAITKEPRPSANLYPRPRFRPRENGTLSFPLCRLMPYTDGSAYSITDGIADGISDGIANDPRSSANVYSGPRFQLKD